MQRLRLGWALAAGLVSVLLPAVAFAGPADDANAGQAALDKGDAKTAIRLFTQVLAAGNLERADQQRAYVRRAKAYDLNGEPVNAALDASAALGIDSGDSEARAIAGKVELLWAKAMDGAQVDRICTFNR